MTLKEVMSPDVAVIPPETTMVEAARRMRELNVGALPVCDGERLSGMITDRDLVVRGLAEGCDPTRVPVRELLSGDLVYVFEDEDVEMAHRRMEESQIRRLPVLSREKRLVGIVSLGDLATKGDRARSAAALEKISRIA